MVADDRPFWTLSVSALSATDETYKYRAWLTLSFPSLRRTTMYKATQSNFNNLLSAAGVALAVGMNHGPSLAWFAQSSQVKASLELSCLE